MAKTKIHPHQMDFTKNLGDIDIQGFRLTAQQLTLDVGDGLAPMLVTSTTKVVNLNVDKLDGADWAAPADLGSGTPAAVTGTILKGNTSVRTPLIEFTDGDDAITIVDGGGVTIGNLTATTADINGGNIDATVIGASGALAGTFQALVCTTAAPSTSLAIAADGAVVTGIKNEANMASNSAVKLATQASIKSYVDDQIDAHIEGIDTKQSVKRATTQALPGCNYANGTAGVGATLTATANGALADIDGSASAVGDRLLVKNQAAELQNGIYEVTVIGPVDEPFVLTRVPGLDQAQDFPGAFVFIESGAVHAGQGWICNVTPQTVGTNDVDFAQFSYAGVATYGDGLDQSGAGLITVDVSDLFVADHGLEEDSNNLRLSAQGNGLTGGAGAVLSLDLDGASLALGGSGVKIKDTGVTEAHLNASVAGVGLVGGANSPLGINFIRETYAYNGGPGSSTTVFDLAQQHGAASDMLLFLNGILQEEGAGDDYVRTDNNTITFANACVAGDVIHAAYFKSN